MIFAIFLMIGFEGTEEKKAVNEAQQASINQETPSITTKAQTTNSIEPSTHKQTAWRIYKNVDAMTDSGIVSASTQASSPIKAWLKSPIPTLVIRCSNNITEAFISTGTRAQPELGNYNQATVTIRFDDKKPYTTLTTESTNGEALFIPKAISFAKQASNSESILIKFTPFNSDPAIASFKGFKDEPEAIDEVRKACGW